MMNFWSPLNRKLRTGERAECKEVLVRQPI
jgi:hypothetical protein